MKKHLDITDNQDYQYIILGVLTHIPIYKLCWAINQALNLKLVRKVLNPDEKEWEGPESKFQESLFRLEDLETYQQEEVYYEDTQTEKHIEYRLFDNSAKKTKVVTFPFIFEAIILPPVNLDIQFTIDTLEKIDNVLSVKDISSKFNSL